MYAYGVLAGMVFHIRICMRNKKINKFMIVYHVNGLYFMFGRMCFFLLNCIYSKSSVEFVEEQEGLSGRMNRVVSQS